ncbi:hypothetical protein RUM44_007282 [Polyplax serrata]|uniref:Uncharacterized protein n=1 Tax=Polyplax serrata TaxID=468196 RepID=A0ABR1B089_POLSC
MPGRAQVQVGISRCLSRATCVTLRAQGLGSLRGIDEIGEKCKNQCSGTVGVSFSQELRNVYDLQVGGQVGLMREEKDKEVPQGSTAVLETLPALQTPGHQVRYSRGCHQIGLPEPGDDHDGNETNMSGVTRWVILTVQKSTPSKIDQQPGLKLIQSKRKMQMADARKSLKRGKTKSFDQRRKSLRFHVLIIINKVVAMATTPLLKGWIQPRDAFEG